MPTTMSVSHLATALFASPLQRSDTPSTDQVRAAVSERLRHGDTACAADLAQEAGDHPETYAPRMRWALETVTRAYASQARTTDATTAAA